MKYLFAVLLLVGCSSSPPPAGGNWVTVWGSDQLPVGSYNPKSDEVRFYAAPAEAFKQLMKAVIESEAARAKAATPPAPTTAKKK